MSKSSPGERERRRQRGSSAAARRASLPQPLPVRSLPLSLHAPHQRWLLPTQPSAPAPARARGGGGAAPRPAALRFPRPPPVVPAPGQPLCFMSLDIIDEGQVGARLQFAWLG